MSQTRGTIDNTLLDLPLNEPPINGKNRLLNDSSVFYKGLFGMILCLVPAAIIGLILIKLSLEQAKVSIKEYDDQPDQYRLSSINMVRRGRTFAFIGLVLFIFEIVALVTYMSVI